MIESKRLIIRKMEQADFNDIAEMLRDPRVMYAWEKTFTDSEIHAWIDRRIAGYTACGHDYFLAVHKERKTAVGQIGLLEEDMGGRKLLGLGWILKFAEQGKGYALEGAAALANYAFSQLGAVELGADIRPQNTASIRVAEKLGMKPEGSYIKIYNGKEMEHTIYILKK